MTSIEFDQGTFTYALMVGMLSMPMAHATPVRGIVEFGHKPLLRGVYCLDGSNATYDNYNNFSIDPYAQFLIKQDPRGAIDFTSTAKPRTELGRKLLEHRRAALARGMKLLSEEDISSMVKAIRGERT